MFVFSDDVFILKWLKIAYIRLCETSSVAGQCQTKLVCDLSNFALYSMM